MLDCDRAELNQRLFRAAERVSSDKALLLGMLWERWRLLYRCQQYGWTWPAIVYKDSLLKRVIRSCRKLPKSKAALVGMWWYRWAYYQARDRKCPRL